MAKQLDLFGESPKTVREKHSPGVVQLAMLPLGGLTDFPVHKQIPDHLKAGVLTLQMPDVLDEEERARVRARELTVPLPEPSTPEAAPKRGRGRPKGSKNKPKVEA